MANGYTQTLGQCGPALFARSEVVPIRIKTMVMQWPNLLSLTQHAFEQSRFNLLAPCRFRCIGHIKFSPQSGAPTR